MGHRRFLNDDHPYRKDVKSFDGNVECGKAPLPLTGDMLQHKTMAKNQNPRLGMKDVEHIHSETFAKWLKNYIEGMHIEGNEISEELRALAQGPNPVGKRYTGFIVNGF
ncbi:hypothetical protein BUALT_Bualt13G0070800 [Buddleja alternifolia]|uniref:Uncharacterized protein n=1 Tax=Buddleja alternifolia TaxID=168488 RepID=A0AAV6WS58_9LAMI|nr:hypothetical protein BUALT_Bualt13G0070800 [Buddleja alternifolia]